MALEEKVGQLIQLSSDFFGTDAELTGPAQSWGLTETQLSTIGSCINGIDVLDNMSYMSADEIHPNIYGVQRIADVLTSKIRI